jgi:hypothetical protein
VYKLLNNKSQDVVVSQVKAVVEPKKVQEEPEKSASESKSKRSKKNKNKGQAPVTQESAPVVEIPKDDTIEDLSVKTDSGIVDPPSEQTQSASAKKKSRSKKQKEKKAAAAAASAQETPQQKQNLPHEVKESSVDSTKSSVDSSKSSSKKSKKSKNESKKENEEKVQIFILAFPFFDLIILLNLVSKAFHTILFSFQILLLDAQIISFLFEFLLL